VAPDPGADEPGLIRLPRSGIEVTFPTATYGPTIAVGPLGNRAAPGLASQVVPALQIVAAQRAEARTWRARPLAACGALAQDHHALTRKLGGCAPTGLRLGQPTPGAQTVTLELALDETHARAFLAGCAGLVSGTSMHDELHATTTVTVTGPIATMERLAAAPFVRRIEWVCPVDLQAR
jgi:hypothetical protein